MIDHVDVGALADFQRAAVGQPVKLGIGGRELADDGLDRDGRPAGAVARPEDELPARQGAVADELGMGAGIAQPGVTDGVSSISRTASRSRST
jgi:hypothetical protein